MDLKYYQALVGANIKKYRKVNNITQDVLATKSDLALRHVQRIEAGEINITLRTLIKLSDSLKVNPADLVKDDHRSAL